MRHGFMQVRAQDDQRLGPEWAKQKGDGTEVKKCVLWRPRTRDCSATAVVHEQRRLEVKDALIEAAYWNA